MLFNSFEFIFLFLPLTLLIFFLVGSKDKSIKQQLQIIWLIIASLVFYGYWQLDSSNLPLITYFIVALSLGSNYYLGHWFYHDAEPQKIKKKTLILGFVINLGLIGYSKYFSNFIFSSTSIDSLGNFFNLFPASIPVMIIGLAFMVFYAVALIAFFYIGSISENPKQSLAIIWLIIASLIFYGVWKPLNLPLIILSIGINYYLGFWLSNSQLKTWIKKAMFILGIVFNLGLISYFKYSNFLLSNINRAIGTNFDLPAVVIPLAISFFTFQQIAYLVDAYRGETKEYDLRKYMLFVCFFPQLIAGPIVHHKEVLPQFEKASIYKFSQRTLSIGLTVFIAGLFKKVIFADRIAEYSNLAFAAASQGINLTFSEAWVGALGYSLQLYFDFSGYSDMAIGAAYMFGIRLPLNFNSPYKAISIVDFWRRWHITLSHFLRDYLYIPLGGSRQGELRRYFNLFTTMLLGGLWHGAGWTFVFWGALHGLYLIINHLYRSVRLSLGHNLKNDGWLLRRIGWITTFIGVVISWVFFKANNFETATSILKSMFGFNGVDLPDFTAPYLGFLRDFGIGFLGFTVNVGISQKYATFGIIILLLIAWFTPNTQQWMGKYNPALTEPREYYQPKWQQKFWHYLSWKPNRIWTIIIASLTSLSLLCFSRVSEFLYFQF